MANPQLDQVGVGSRVKIVFGDGACRVFRVSDASMGSPHDGILNIRSPLGLVLLGKPNGFEGVYSVGHTVFYFKILEIEN